MTFTEMRAAVSTRTALLTAFVLILSVLNIGCGVLGKAKDTTSSSSTQTGSLSISTTTLPNATQNSSYSANLSASGGTTPYSWSITGLPSGLSLSTSGAISGTPTTNGTFVLTAKVTDAGSSSTSLMIPLIVTSTRSSLSIATTSLPPATVGTAYSVTLAATGGTSPYSWSASAVPPGLSLSSAGVISGTPTVSGTFGVTAAVTDSKGASSTLSGSVTVSQASGTVVLTLSPQSGSLTTSQSQTLTATVTGSTNTSVTFKVNGTTVSTSATQYVFSAQNPGTYTITAVANADTSKTASATITVAGVGYTTWYVRPDGGTRYSTNQTSGQCDGKSDAPYPGTGANQHCAFNDYRYLYSDGSYGNKGWVIAGGDTVILRGGPWRVGYNGPNPNDYFGNDPGSPYSSYNPPIPSGTSAHHTRILGENFAACTSSNKTQLFGGHAVSAVLNLKDTQYLDVQCVEITDHAQCGRMGQTNLCNSDFPLNDDFATNGIIENLGTGNIWLVDVDIHGFASRGIIGPIGGDVTTKNLRIAFNTGAGWDLDDGSGQSSTGGTITLQNAIVEWNGCTEEYPIVDSVPAFACWDQNSGGYGDAIGTADRDAASFRIDQSVFRYNTQDGPDLLHSANGSFIITRSYSYGNMGQQIKLGATSNSTIQNSIIIHDCNRLSAPFSGAPASYNTHLSNFCRAAGDGIAIGWGGPGTIMQFDNNTFVGYGATIFDIFCTDSTTCAGGTKTLRNNIVVGYTLSGYNAGQKPGAFCLSSCNGTTNLATENMWTARSNNVFYNLRYCPVGTFSNESCSDPELAAIPSVATSITAETQLDLSNIDLHLAPGSSSKGAGIPIDGLTVDFFGTTRQNPPNLGAIE